MPVQSLENRGLGIRLLNVRRDDSTKTVRATVYIPAGQESYFLKKVDAYSLPVEEGKKPANNNLVRSIEDVKVAIFDSFWIGLKNDQPKEDPAWCEIWLRYDDGMIDESENEFARCCNDLIIFTSNRHIVFHERVVRLVYANIDQLRELINKCEYIAEIRRASEPTSFYDDMPAIDQNESMRELLSRIEIVDSNSYICILDTGIAAGHPMLARFIEDEHIQAVNNAWGITDHEGHGTEMAGVALFYDLKQKLTSKLPYIIPHRLESVKILPPRGENTPDLYGAITEQAVALAEIANPKANHTFCMAVTSSQYNTRDGSPTSWSAAIDKLASGADGSNDKRLFIVSAGNVEPDEFMDIEYPDANLLHSVESPGQSWNALTVGAYAGEANITAQIFMEYSSISNIDELSPYSSTSHLWNHKWPIKPEILLDGGNIATNGLEYTSCPDLSLLTTNRRPLVRPYTTIWGTSSAAAQAACMAAQISVEYPDAWPETVRALIVHSARWTNEMKHQFCQVDTKSKGRRNLLRVCGYGIPNLDNAIQSMRNSVNLVIEGELQPFNKKSMHEMHLHKIPWPTEVLKSLHETQVELRITLSYFIEPGPGEIGWKDRYRYPSCGLRFDIMNTDEKVEDFSKRVNIKMRGEDKKDKGEGSSGSERWYLGSDNRDVGSIHSDFIIDSAVNLSNTNYCAVYPIIGWWRERDYLRKSQDKVRYALVVSLSTPQEEADFYTPIITQIPEYITTDIPV